MKDVLSLARPELLSLKPYESARSLNQQGRIFLDANESSSSPFSDSKIHRYPDPQPRELLERFSKIYAVPTSKLLIGRGSDEAIDLIVRGFCRAGKDKILICPPTYGMYEVSARIQNAEVVRVPLIQKNDDSSLDESKIEQSLSNDPNIKVLFLCSPNNPTGTAFDPMTMNRICEVTANRCLVVIDEAYAEFSDQVSMINALGRYPHLVVLRTLSKAWALAGARCGVAIGSEEVIQFLQKIRPPYPLSLPSIEIILEGTHPQRQIQLIQRVKSLQMQKEFVKLELLNLKSVRRVYKSSANFLLVQFEDASKVLRTLKQRGIIVRDRSHEPLLENCIRITLGSREENVSLLTTLSELSNQQNSPWTYCPPENVFRPGNPYELQ